MFEIWETENNTYLKKAFEYETIFFFSLSLSPTQLCLQLPYLIFLQNDVKSAGLVINIHV